MSFTRALRRSLRIQSVCQLEEGGTNRPPLVNILLNIQHLFAGVAPQIARGNSFISLWCALALFSASTVFAADQETTESAAFHAQTTFVLQYHPAFHSAYRGPNSLDPGSRGQETFDTTFYAGTRLWGGMELWINPEIDQGFGLSNTLGVAGFPSGEANKVGKSSPYLRLQRLFFRQSIDLGGEVKHLDGDANQLAGETTANNLVVTFGKILAVDIFDTNTYAHDPRSDFMNWSIVDSGAYDYAADAWGYTYGIALEWTQSWWTLRTGLFDLSRIPNTTALERGFGQREMVAEFERRHMLWGLPGKVKLLGFVNQGRMGSYRDAVQLARITSSTPDTALVRRFASRPGLALNIEQQVAADLGLFIRASLNEGSEEAFEFTEINQSIATGGSLRGAAWGRVQDTIGLAAVVNGLSNAGRGYLAAGGMGILIGDGKLLHYGPEEILEAYYNAELTDWLFCGFDYQLVVHPAYNQDRGPVSVLGARLHAEF